MHQTQNVQIKPSHPILNISTGVMKSGVLHAVPELLRQVFSIFYYIFVVLLCSLELQKVLPSYHINLKVL